MRFLVDAQLPPALARWLAAAGHPADHVADLGLASAADLTIWAAALERRAAIITKDKDFAQLGAAAADGPPVVWIRLANTRRGALLDWFEGVLPDIIAALQRGEAVVELT